MNDGISMEGIIQVALLDVLILQIKSGGPEMLGSRRACLPSPDSAGGCRPLRASQCLWVANRLLTAGQSCLVLPTPPPRVGLGPHGLLSFPGLCDQWSLFPLRAVLPGRQQQLC